MNSASRMLDPRSPRSSDDSPLPRRFCVACGIRFKAAAPSHHLCLTCYRWSVSIRAVRIISRVMREERR